MDRNNNLLKAKRRYKVLLREQEKLRKENRSDSDIDGVIASLLAEFPELNDGGCQESDRKNVNQQSFPDQNEEGVGKENGGNNNNNNNNEADKEPMLHPLANTTTNTQTRPSDNNDSHSRRHDDDATTLIAEGHQTTLTGGGSSSRLNNSDHSCMLSNNRAATMTTEGGTTTDGKKDNDRIGINNNNNSGGDSAISTPLRTASTTVESSRPPSAPSSSFSAAAAAVAVAGTKKNATVKASSSPLTGEQVGTSKLRKLVFSLFFSLLAVVAEAQKPSLVGRSTFMRCVLTSVAIAFVHERFLDPVEDPVGRALSPLIFCLLIHLNNVYWLYVQGRGRSGLAMVMVYIFLDFIPSCALVMLTYTISAVLIDYAVGA